MAVDVCETGRRLELAPIRGLTSLDRPNLHRLLEGMSHDSIVQRSHPLIVDGQTFQYYRLDALERAGARRVAAAVLAQDPAREPAPPRGRHRRSRPTTSRRWRSWDPKAEPDREIAFRPSRVLLQDFTGVPAVVDLAAMRDAMKQMGGDPRKINPLQPVELVIDHSVQVDEAGTPLAFADQRRARVQPQPRALRVPPLGPERLRELPGRAARHRHRPPGEPRVPGPRRLHRAGADDGQSRWPIPTRWSAPTRTRR